MRDGIPKSSLPLLPALANLCLQLASRNIISLCKMFPEVTSCPLLCRSMIYSFKPREFTCVLDADMTRQNLCILPDRVRHQPYHYCNLSSDRPPLLRHPHGPQLPREVRSFPQRTWYQESRCIGYSIDNAIFSNYSYWGTNQRGNHALRIYRRCCIAWLDEGPIGLRCPGCVWSFDRLD